MRIENNLRAGNVTGRGSTSRSGQSGAAFHVEEGGAAARAHASVATASSAPIDALLALQAAEDPTRGRKKAIRRGRSMLDTLDALKADLLMGRISEGHLNQLMALLGQAREQADPALDGVLDDIELRVRVELAKRGLFLSP